MNHPIRKYSVTWIETLLKDMEWFPCRDPEALVKYLEEHPLKKGVELILAYSAEDAITQFKIRNRNLAVTDIAPFEEPFFMEEAPGVAIGNVNAILKEDSSVQETAPGKDSEMFKFSINDKITLSRAVVTPSGWGGALEGYPSGTTGVIENLYDEQGDYYIVRLEDNVRVKLRRDQISPASSKSSSTHEAEKVPLIVKKVERSI